MNIQRERDREREKEKKREREIEAATGNFVLACSVLAWSWIEQLINHCCAGAVFFFFSPSILSGRSCAIRIVTTAAHWGETMRTDASDL